MKIMMLGWMSGDSNDTAIIQVVDTTPPPPENIYYITITIQRFLQILFYLFLLLWHSWLWRQCLKSLSRFLKWDRIFVNCWERYYMNGQKTSVTLIFKVIFRRGGTECSPCVGDDRCLSTRLNLLRGLWNGWTRSLHIECGLLPQASLVGTP